MKERFENAEIEIVWFDVEDVIATSGGSITPDPDELPVA